MNSRALVRAAAFLLIVVTLSGCIVVSEPPVTTPPPPRPAPPLPPPAPRPAVTIDVDFFYGALEPYGDWLWIEPHGWVWAPNAVDPFWRPYTIGRWVWTDWGWTWVSAEPWGWAPYHYGRWVRARHHGWVWVPGTVWGPAWVAWRHGGGYAGWAPLPPEVGFRVGFGLDFGGVDIDVVIRHDVWCFVDEVRFVEPDVFRYAHPVGRNKTVIAKTRDVTKVRVVDQRIVNEGVDRGEIERITRRAVPVRRVVDGPGGSDRAPAVTQQEVRVYRPQVRDARPGVEPPRGRKPAAAPSPPLPSPRPSVEPPADRKSPQAEAERRFDKRWLDDWRKLERAQEAEERRTAPPAPSTARKPVPPQRREENYEAAENASRELEAEKERAKRNAERAPAPAPGARKAKTKPPEKDDKKE